MHDSSSIDVDDTPLVGTLPPEIAALTSLKIAFMPGYGLKGPIDTLFVNMTSLEQVALNDNQLTGRLPDFARYNPSLKSLILSQNLFTGTFDHNLVLMPNLQTLEISRNKVVGNISVNLLKNSVLGKLCHHSLKTDLHGISLSTLLTRYKRSVQTHLIWEITT